MFEKDGYICGGSPEAPRLDVISVAAVKPLDGYRLWLKFEDGAERIYDVAPDLDGPAFQPLKNKSIFDSVYLQYGATVWQDGEIDIAPETLYYEGTPVNA